MLPPRQCLDAAEPSGDVLVLGCNVEAEFLGRIVEIGDQREVRDSRTLAEHIGPRRKPSVENPKAVVDTALEKCEHGGIAGRPRQCAQKAIGPEESVNDLHRAEVGIDEQLSSLSSRYKTMDRKTLAAEAVTIATRQLMASTDFKKPRMAKLTKYWELYDGKVPKKLRQLFNVPIPVFPGMIDTLNAQYDTPNHPSYCDRLIFASMRMRAGVLETPARP
jgi:hypothetical protein